MACKIGSPDKDIYIMDDGERAAVCEGLQQAARGELVSDEEMDAFWKEILGALSRSAEDVRQGKFATDEEYRRFSIVIDPGEADAPKTLDELAQLRAEIQIGLYELDAGLGEELDIEELIREARDEYAKEKRRRTCALARRRFPASASRLPTARFRGTNAVRATISHHNSHFGRRSCVSQGPD
jgi:hypothetical protein